MGNCSLQSDFCPNVPIYRPNVDHNLTLQSVLAVATKAFFFMNAIDVTAFMCPRIAQRSGGAWSNGIYVGLVNRYKQNHKKLTQLKIMSLPIRQYDKVR